MVARTRRKPSKQKARTGGRRKVRPAPPARESRPALGNDPFARGAAPRPVAPVTPRSTPPEGRAGSGSDPGSSTGAPLAPQRPAPPPDRTAAEAVRLAAVERRVEAALDGLEERLVALADRAGLRGAGHELRQALRGLLPRLRGSLASAVDVFRLFESPAQLDAFGLDARFAERFAPVADLLYASWWRTTVRDAGRVPAEGPAVVVANHAGVVPWDALVLREALRRDHPAHRSLRPLLDDRECALPLVGAALVRLGAVRAGPQAAEALLREGQLVGVFPEGSAGARKPWRERYRLQRFGRGGFVKLALRCRAPIVPCAIVGSEEASPGISRSGWLAERLGVPLIGKGAALRFGPAALLPLPSRWSLRFGEPIPVAEHGAAAADDEALVHALTEQVRSALQTMVDEDLGARSSVFL